MWRMKPSGRVIKVSLLRLGMVIDIIVYVGLINGLLFLIRYFVLGLE